MKTNEAIGIGFAAFCVFTAILGIHAHIHKIEDTQAQEPQNADFAKGDVKRCNDLYDKAVGLQMLLRCDSPRLRWVRAAHAWGDLAMALTALPGDDTQLTAGICAGYAHLDINESKILSGNLNVKWLDNDGNKALGIN
jgi:hypothetical protein